MGVHLVLLVFVIVGDDHDGMLHGVTVEVSEQQLSIKGVQYIYECSDGHREGVCETREVSRRFICPCDEKCPMSAAFRNLSRVSTASLKAKYAGLH